MSRLIRPASVLGLALFALAGACGRRRTTDEVVPKIALEVYNASFFQVNVYALPTSAGPRVRIGTALSFNTTKLPIPMSAYRAGGSLVLQLHAFGTNRWWTSPELPMSRDVTPCLEIYSDATGDLSRTNFFSVTTPDSIPAADARRTICGFVNTVSDAQQIKSAKRP